jgi:hypothetical protein
MQDLAYFELVRPPRRPDLSGIEKVMLGCQLIEDLGNSFAQGGQPGSPEVEDVIRKFRGEQADPLPFAAQEQDPAGVASLEIAVLLGQLEQWLADQHDRPAGADLVTELRQLQAAYSGREAPWAQALSDFIALLSGWLAIWVIGGDTDSVATGTRLVLVAALVTACSDLLDAGDAPPPPVNQTWDMLNRRVVIFPAALAAAFAHARVPLVRQATVADLQVVRSEWRGYVAGEIASIRNVMAGEKFGEVQKQTSRTETTQTQDTQTTTSQQTELQETDESDLSRELNTQLGVSVQGYLNANVQEKTPGYSASVSAGVSGGVQIGRNENLATKISKQAVTRAIATVESKTREIRSQRTMVQTEDTTNHEFESKDENRRGVYRWVDRVDRYQVFTYPQRLQLEFELPQPAEYVNWRIANHKAQADDAPPDWDPAYLAQNIDVNHPELAQQAAAHFRAASLPTLPDQLVSVVASVSAQPSNLPTDFSAAQWNPPTITKTIEIAIPDSYIATTVTFSGYVTPLRGNWHSERTQHNGADNLDSFHTIAASVTIGDQTAAFLQAGPAGNTNSVMQPLLPEPQFAEALLQIPAPGDPADPRCTMALDSATQKVDLGVQAVGAGALTMSFTVACQRTSQAEAEWKSAVYDALFSAWSDWNRTYQSAQQNSALLGTLPAGQSSPDQNQQVIIAELKRQVISWLLSESPFPGRPALLPPGPDATTWRDIDLAAALASAPDIQFMEQAFDWTNISYIFYPYYWADRSVWDDLNTISDPDPAYEAFRKAGSARVVVPARPGMEPAVHYWLLYQKPFLGRPMPIPGSPMFVSVATEIRDLTGPSDDGIDGQSWESVIGTTFLWLDDSDAKLPSNPLATLGAPPNEPAEILYPPKNHAGE